MTAKNRSNRSQGKIHFLTADGMLACNPRDREAAHRAEFAEMASQDIHAVTCQKCWQAYRRLRDQGQDSRGEQDR